MYIKECAVGDAMLFPFPNYFYCCIILDGCLVQHVNGNIEELFNYMGKRISEARFLEIEQKGYKSKKLSAEDFREEYRLL